MPNSETLEMPMKFGLKFMAIIRADGMDAERKLGNHMIDKIYGVQLRMAVINLQGPDPGGIIDSRILETPEDFLSGFWNFKNFTSTWIW